MASSFGEKPRTLSLLPVRLLGRTILRISSLILISTYAPLSSTTHFAPHHSWWYGCGQESRRTSLSNNIACRRKWPMPSLHHPNGHQTIQANRWRLFHSVPPRLEDHRICISKLQWIQDRLPDQKGIWFCNTKHAVSEPTADMAMFLTLAVTRDTSRSEKSARLVFGGVVMCHVLILRVWH